MRALPSHVDCPVPPGVQALGREVPDLRFRQVHAFIRPARDRHLGAAEIEVAFDFGGGPRTAIETGRKRWAIECLFGDAKANCLNLEHKASPNRASPAR